MREYAGPLFVLCGALVVGIAVLALLGTARPVVDDGAGIAALPAGSAAGLLVARSPACAGACAAVADELAAGSTARREDLALVVLDDPVAAGATLEAAGFAAQRIEAWRRGEPGLLVATLDRAARAHARFAVGAGSDPRVVVEAVERDAAFLLGLARRPWLHARLNTLCALLLLLGFACVRRRAITGHLICMVLAALTSAVFLASYLYYHYHAGSVPFRGEGWVRPVYFGILLTHTVLAALVAPLAASLFWLAGRRRFERHRRVARWALPMWLYVSATGVVIYFMVYVWFPGS